MVKIQNEIGSDPKPNHSGNIIKKSKRFENGYHEKDSPVMDSEEAIAYITSLAEKASNELKTPEPISLTIKSKTGVLETYTLLPSKPNENSDSEYVLVVTQPQQTNGTVNNDNQTLLNDTHQNGCPHNDHLENISNGDTNILNGKNCHGKLDDDSDEDSNTNLWLLSNRVTFKEENDEELMKKLEMIRPRRGGRVSHKNKKAAAAAFHQESGLGPCLNDEPYACNQCEYAAKHKYQLARHMHSHCSARPYKCKYCDRGYKSALMLSYHINSHRGLKPFKCNQCPMAFATPGELHRHRQYKHTQERPHKCSECDYSCVEYSKLRRHMQAHLGFKPFSCPHCTFRSVDNFKLKRHLRIHTGEKPFACDICLRRFTQSNTLKTHMFVHSGRKPQFKCHLCPATLTRKTDLRIHFKTMHNNEKPLICRKCGKFFPDRYSYKVHNKLHEGERCFKCLLCSYAGLSERALQNHMFMHTDERPFKCHYCNSAFKRKVVLQRHIDNYHDFATGEHWNKSWIKVEFQDGDSDNLRPKKRGPRPRPDFFPPPDPALQPLAHKSDHAYSVDRPRLLDKKNHRQRLKSIFGPGYSRTRLTAVAHENGTSGVLGSKAGCLSKGLKEEASCFDNPDRLTALSGIADRMIACEMPIIESNVASVKASTTDPKPRLFCVKCKKSYASNVTLKRHLKNKHGSTDTPQKLPTLPELSATIELLSTENFVTYQNDTLLDEINFLHGDNVAKSCIKDMQEDLMAFTYMENISAIAVTAPGSIIEVRCDAPSPHPSGPSSIAPSPSVDQAIASPNQSDGLFSPTYIANGDLGKELSSVYFGDLSASNLLLTSPRKNMLQATLMNAFTEWDSMKITSRMTSRVPTKGMAVKGRTRLISTTSSQGF